MVLGVSPPRCRLTTGEGESDDLVLGDRWGETDAFEEEVHGANDATIWHPWLRPRANPMEQNQGQHKASLARILAAGVLLGGLSLPGLTLVGCAGSSAAGTELSPAGTRGRNVQVVEATYSLGVDRAQAVTGSIAVAVVDPAGLSRELRQLSARELVLVEGEPWVPRVLDPTSQARIVAEVETADRVFTWQAPRAFPLGAIDPRDVAMGLVADEGVGAAARASFIAFAEQLLLRRDPLGGEPLAGACARAWFGLLVTPRADEEHPLVPTLADLLFELFREQDAEGASELEAAGWYRPSPDAAWGVPRWLRLREVLGVLDFTAGLRAVVDAGVSGAPQGLDEVATAFGGDGEGFIRSWLKGPAGPLVETSWRVDSDRGRLLLRVDQLQRVVPGGAPAYTFALPVTIELEDGGQLQRTLEVTRRKELFQVPVEGLTGEVIFDPEQTLQGFVKMRAARDA